MYNSDNDFFDDTETLKESMINIKTTTEYSFQRMKLIHEKNEKNETFRVYIPRNDEEMNVEEAKALYSILGDIFNEGI